MFFGQPIQKRIRTAHDHWRVVNVIIGTPNLVVHGGGSISRRGRQRGHDGGAVGVLKLGHQSVAERELDARPMTYVVLLQLG